MKRGRRFLAALASTAFIVSISATSFRAAAADRAPILIAEVQTGSLSSASQEFIELVNVTHGTIDVSNWRVEYYSASTTDFVTPSRVMPLAGSMPAGAHYLLSTAGYLVGSAHDSFAAGLAASGGHLRLIEQDPDNPSSPKVHDTLGWGTAVRPEATPAKAAEAGASMQRKLDQQDSLIDTNNNADDFEITSPSPEGFVRSPADIEPAASDGTSPSPQIDVSTDDEQVLLKELDPGAPLIITELLPNPKPPQTDANDEFVEIYNPTSGIVFLADYKLQTGNTYNHSYEFTDESIGPGEYMALYVSTTGAVLANSAGKARLISPRGDVLSETAAYEDAEDGVAWAWAGSVWQWTTTPTPNASNVIQQKQQAESAKAASTKAAKRSTPKKAATKKAKATKASVKGVQTGANGSGAGAAADLNAKPQVHTAIILGVGALAVAYAGYEYRRDIANALHAVRSRFTH